jgi:hypothetical protein
VTDVGHAVVLGELLSGDHVFPIGLFFARATVGFLESVDHQRPVDFLGLFAVGVIEHEPTGKAPR